MRDTLTFEEWKASQEDKLARTQTRKKEKKQKLLNQNVTNPNALGISYSTKGEPVGIYLSKGKEEDPQVWIKDPLGEDNQTFLSRVLNDLDGLFPKGTIILLEQEYDLLTIFKGLDYLGARVKFEVGALILNWRTSPLNRQPTISFRNTSPLVRNTAKTCKALDLEVMTSNDLPPLPTDLLTMGSNPDLQHLSKIKEIQIIREQSVPITNLGTAQRGLLELGYSLGMVEGRTPMSLGGMSLSIFDDNFFPIKKIHANTEHRDLTRLGLYGMRTEAYTYWNEGPEDPVYLQDLRSQFLWAYQFPVPVGELTYIGNNRLSMDHGTLGQAEVEVPTDWFIGPLPYHREGDLIFPTGRFTGWWDMVELRYAQELGCRVKLLRQLECTEYPILKEFGEYFYSKKLDAERTLGKEHPKAKLYKQIGVLLQGKFAQHDGREEIVSRLELCDCAMCIVGDKTPDGQAYKNCRYKYGTWSVLDPLGNYFKVYSKTPAWNARPLITTRIRSLSRIRIHQELNKVLQAGGKLYYTDTDSCHSSTRLPEGSNYGDLDLVSIAHWFGVLGPKVYFWIDPNGTPHQKVSGVSPKLFSDSQIRKIILSNIMEREPLTVYDRYRSTSSIEGYLQGERLLGNRVKKVLQRNLTGGNRILDAKDNYLISRPIVLEG